ncbi:MAG: PHP domain-containing protein [Clostridiales bacterium]|nr:PHP domain-containing protein [Clostridiales bacterium]
MLLLDTHMHSTVSFDGHSSRREMAEASMAFGLDVICFTDHYDIINEKNQFCPTYDWIPARQAHQEALEVIPKGNPFQLLYGLELGNAPADFGAAERALAEPGLDCVIGSIHNASLAMAGQDLALVDYQTHPELARPYLEDYFASMLALARWGNYDTLGHILYPLRYIRDRDGVQTGLSDYWEACRALLRRNAEAGKALEVNTNRGRDSLEDYRALLPAWREAGGKLVTVGADAHHRDHVGLGIQRAYDLLRDCGFRYVTYYVQRKPVMVKL